MIYCNPFGGIGNQLFMVAATIGTSRKYGCEYKITENWPNAYYFKGIFNLGTEHLPQYTEDWGYHFQPIKKTNVELVGYFQSEKYFHNCEKEIKKLFQPNDEIADLIRTKYGYLLAAKTMGVHVRRGDYLKLSEYHYNLELEYYTDLMDQFNGDYTFVIFSDDIEWCIMNFGHYKNCHFIQGNQDIVDFHLMAQMDNLIMANSSFSWWAGYLSEGQVYCPPKDKWFGKKNAHFNVNDLYRNEWKFKAGVLQ